MNAHARRTAAIGALVTGIGMTWTVSSRAEETTVVTTPAAPTAAEAKTYTGPNRTLLTAGLVTFGASYVPAVIVAATSSQSADHHLYVPIVGPWLDLGNRPGCDAVSVSCDMETTNKVVIAVDGVFQGIGAVTTVVAFLRPERETVVSTAADKPVIHVTPARMGAGGYGVAAIGTF